MLPDMFLRDEERCVETTFVERHPFRYQKASLVWQDRLGTRRGLPRQARDTRNVAMLKRNGVCVCVCVRVCVFCAQRYRPTAEEFRGDEETFWAEFARSFKQLTEAGMPPLPLPLPLPPVSERE
jgi:hypothetical protein